VAIAFSEGRSTAYALAALTLVATAFYVLAGEKITLVAEDEVDLIAEPVVDPANQVIVGKLRPSESLVVTSCHDMKHYIVPEVRLSNGQTAYVVRARFRLVRRPAWSTFEGPTVFSCRAIA
jgi:hypothetical protein